MAKKWIALNFVLLLAAVGLARELYQRYEQFKAETDLASIEMVYVENQETADGISGVSTDVSFEMPIRANADYFVISERTLFSDTRGREEPLQAVQPKVQQLNPKPVLVGTMLIDGQFTASVINTAPQVAATAATQAKTQAQAQAQTTAQAQAQARAAAQNTPETWHIGYNHRGFTVISIDAEQMVLENSGLREIIPLNRSARRAPAAKPQMMASANVISLGPAGTSSGAVTVSTSAAAPGVRGAGRPGGPGGPGGAQGGQQGRPAGGPGGAQGGQQAQRNPITISTPEGNVLLNLPENVQNLLQERLGQQGSSQGAAKPAAKAKPAQGGQTVIQELRLTTPFGDILR